MKKKEYIKNEFKQKRNVKKLQDINENTEYLYILKGICEAKTKAKRFYFSQTTIDKYINYNSKSRIDKIDEESEFERSRFELESLKKITQQINDISLNSENWGDKFLNNRNNYDDDKLLKIENLENKLKKEYIRCNGDIQKFIDEVKSIKCCFESINEYTYDNHDIKENHKIEESQGGCTIKNILEKSNFIGEEIGENGKLNFDDDLILKFYKNLFSYHELIKDKNNDSIKYHNISMSRLMKLIKLFENYLNAKFEICNSEIKHEVKTNNTNQNTNYNYNSDYFPSSSILNFRSLYFEIRKIFLSPIKDLLFNFNENKNENSKIEDHYEEFSNSKIENGKTEKSVNLDENKNNNLNSYINLENLQLFKSHLEDIVKSFFN